MAEGFRWSKQAQGFRAQVPATVADGIDAVGINLPAEADAEAVLAALRDRGLGFLQAIVGLMAICDVSLADAKLLVHKSQVFASDRTEREAFWAAMHAEVIDMPEPDPTTEHHSAEPEEPQRITPGNSRPTSP